MKTRSKATLTLRAMLARRYGFGASPNKPPLCHLWPQRHRRYKQMVKVALVVSIIALAVCLLTALHGVLSDGLKGLKQRSKPISISFLIYAVAFLLFIFFQ